MSEKITEPVKKLKGLLITDSHDEPKISKSREILTAENREMTKAIKKAPLTRDSFGSVEEHFEGTLSPRSTSDYIKKYRFVNCMPWGRRGDLHPHLLGDKTDVPLHELRRQTDPRTISFKQFFKRKASC